MTKSNIFQALWLPLAMGALFLAAIFFRPLLPIDETRYMTVAWEMFLRQNWLQPLTVNFEPYHHKPPLLFWLINLSWSVFGVSRWAGLIPIVVASLSCVYLTAALGKYLFPKQFNPQHSMLIMLGSVPFLIYSTLVLFDLTLCVFVLLSLLSICKLRQERRVRYALLLGIFLGLGVLTKGPVAYLYVLPVALSAPLWAGDFDRLKNWYGCILFAILVSVIPVLFWLIPVLKASNNDFAFWLVWNQTAGRVTGNFSAAHNRPIWFYVPLLPVILMPWIFFPTFWTGIKKFAGDIRFNEGLRFLAFTFVPVFIAFSLISGKQPHYLVPLLPCIVLLLVYRFQHIPTKTLAKVSFGMILALIIGHAIASQTFLKKYTLEPVAQVVAAQPERDLLFVRNYHGELGFMARHVTSIDDRQMDGIDEWFEDHPDGWAVIRFKEGQSEVQKYKMLMSYPYRGKYLGVFEKP